MLYSTLSKIYFKIKQFKHIKFGGSSHFFPYLGLVILMIYVGIILPIKISEAAEENLVADSSFENVNTNWTNPWIFESRTGAVGTISKDSTAKISGTYSAKVEVTQSSSTKHLVQIRQRNINLANGKKYEVSFWAKASANRNILVALQQSTSPYTVYKSQNVNITTSWQKHSFTYDSTVNDTTSYISFNFAESTGTVWLDDVSVAEVVAAPSPIPSPDPSPEPSPTSAPAAKQSVSSEFVTRIGADLYLKGAKTRFEGPNIFWLGLLEGAKSYPSHFMIEDALASAKEMGANMARAFATASVGCNLCIQPTRGNFNDEAFESIDYAIKEAQENDIKLVMVLVDNYKYYLGGKYTYLNWRGIANDDQGQFFTDQTVIDDFKKHISYVLNHTNKYTGVKYKDDPTILAWETGNEVYPTSGWVNTSIACWTKQVADHIKVTEQAKQLVIDGHYGVDVTPSGCASSPNNALGLENVDIYSDHYMSPTKIGTSSNLTKNNNKVFMLGEYNWTGKRFNYTTGFWYSSDALDLESYTQAIRNNPVGISSTWSLFPHKEPNGFFTHGDGYALYYPGYALTLSNKDGSKVSLSESDIQQRGKILREHAFTMRGLGIPAYSCPSSPVLHPVSAVSGGVRVNWRGVVGAATYNIERSTDGGATWNVVKTGLNDFNSPWIDPTGSTGYKYRIRGVNLRDVKGDYSDGTKGCSGATTPAPSSLPIPSVVPSPSSQISTPVPSVSPTPKPSELQSPTASPAVSDCTLSTAAWNVKTKAVKEGTVVDLEVTTSGNCKDQSMSFRVVENDSVLEGIGDDVARISPENITIVGNKMETTWIAEYQEDGMLGIFDPPEYYFVATLVGGNKTIRSADPLLVVVKNLDPVIVAKPKVQVDKDKVTIDWQTNLDASSMVKIGLPDQDLISTSEQNINTRTKNHQVTVTSLIPCTTYQYVTTSKDENAKSVSSDKEEFTTSGCAGDAQIIDQTYANVIQQTGGLINLTDPALKGISLDVPSGYSDSDAQFQIKQLAKQPVVEKLAIPSTYQLVGDYVYNLNAFSNISSRISAFNKSVTVTMHYTDTNVESYDESSLIITRYDGNSWHNLSNCVIDGERNSISCKTGAFSVVALIGIPDIENPTPSPTPSPSISSSSSSDSGSNGNNSSSNNSSSSESSSDNHNVADLNSSGKVDITDLSLLLRNWGRSGVGDINGSGKVDISDLSVLMRNWSS